MIVTEEISINRKEFVKTYSSTGNYIERDGVRYDEAIDPVEFGRVYTEVCEPITKSSSDLIQE